MRRDQFADLSAFATVAEERSFTRAAINLGMSSSALSHSLKALEVPLVARMVTRTTRSVAPTEASKELLEAIVPAFETINAALDRLNATRDVPAGMLRITTVKHAARHVLGPAVSAFLRRFPEIAVEIHAEDQHKDIIADGFNAGVRLGDQVAKDMLSLRISEAIPTALVAAPVYFEHRPMPASPHDLVAHDCVGHRMGTGAMHGWPFSDGNREFSVKVGSRATFNDSGLILDAALAGGGLTYVFADQAEEHCRTGRLVSVLDCWTIIHPSSHLHYATLCQQPSALATLVEWLRTRTAPVRC